MLLLRNRSRAVASKQTRMSDHSSLPSPKQNQTTPISSFLASPRFFNGFLTRSVSDAESQRSPTSILDSKSFSNFGNPFGYDKNFFSLANPSLENDKPIYEKIDGIGLALIDSLNNEKDDESTSKPNSKMVLFGAKLKVQIPPLPTSAPLPDATPQSPADFGIKTRNSQLLGSSPAFGSPNYCLKAKESPQAFSEGMELSEEYTCVITRGPNPKTTHIFDDCIVESCCGVGSLSNLKKEYGVSVSTDNSNSLPVNFLTFCYSCKNKLGDGKDIYMYRGEKAFCSHECRCQEMLLEDEAKNTELDDYSMA